MDAIEELWFTRPTLKGKGKAAIVENERFEFHLAKIAKVVMNVTGVYGDRPPPVEDVLRLVGPSRCSLSIVTTTNDVRIGKSDYP